MKGQILALLFSRQGKRRQRGRNRHGPHMPHFSIAFSGGGAANSANHIECKRANLTDICFYQDSTGSKQASSVYHKGSTKGGFASFMRLFYPWTRSDSSQPTCLHRIRPAQLRTAISIYTRTTEAKLKH